MARAELVRAELERCGIEYVVWLPDSETRTLYDNLVASPGLRLIQVCREDEAVGIAVGLYLGGKNVVVLIQNTGLFNTVDVLRGIVLDQELPLLVLAGYKGYRAMVEGKKSVDSAAIYTEPLLNMLGIRHHLVDSDEDVERIGLAYREAISSNRPVAVLMGKE